jgi:hypothetical protein
LPALGGDENSLIERSEVNRLAIGIAKCVTPDQAMSMRGKKNGGKRPI